MDKTMKFDKSLIVSQYFHFNFHVLYQSLYYFASLEGEFSSADFSLLLPLRLVFGLTSP